MQHKIKLTRSNLAFMVVTRALLGSGIALLAAGRIRPRIRRAVGLGLLGVGVATTIPIMRTVMRA